MKRILLTGGTGFVGRNIRYGLEQKYEVYAPGRLELDIKNTLAVEQTIKTGIFDAVVLAGIPTKEENRNTLESDVLQSGLLSFMNFYRVRNDTGRIIYFGSGAEFDKQQDISFVTEASLSKRLPVEPYGFSKFLMNQLAVSSDNVYNLRLFGCFGPTDGENKFITHCIRCCMEGNEITIRQDCMFNFLYVDNLLPVLSYCIENRPQFHDYNVCSGRNLLLSEVAAIVKKEMKSSSEVVVLNSEAGKQYSASNGRLLGELPDFEQTYLEEGVQKQILSILNF